MSLASNQAYASRYPEPEFCSQRPQHAQGEAVPERSLELCECMLDIVGAMFNICGRELRKPGRSSLAVSRVRQIAMYVCHVVIGLGMRDIGCGFSRDRTTVVYACQVVEDMRDDSDFDCIVHAVEQVALAALRCRGEGRR